MSTRGSRQFKTACFAIEGMTSFSVCIFSYYIYFLMRDRFGFTGRDNLAFAAFNGLVYTIAAWQGGRFGQRRGYFNALKLGFGIMILALAAGWQFQSVIVLVLATAAFNAGMCFIWPTIEALISEGEDATGLPRRVGTYNVVWASTNALALFGGGTLVEKFGFNAIFYLPIAFFIAALAGIFWLAKHTTGACAAGHESVPVPAPDPHRPSPAKTNAFLRMAWVANPFAYIAINTFIPMLPTLAAHFHLTPMFAGFACSLWGFARLGTFIALWLWTGWHYHFRWLVTAFAMLIVSFAAILIVPSLVAVLAAQAVFGAAIGLIYYSSLFYSMDAGKDKGDNGGIHEAAIGIGNFIGPGVGAASLQFLPQHAHSGAVAVSVLLLFGLGGLVTIWKTAR
jgi:MFS family permease